MTPAQYNMALMLFIMVSTFFVFCRLWFREYYGYAIFVAVAGLCYFWLIGEIPVWVKNHS